MIFSRTTVIFLLATIVGATASTCPTTAIATKADSEPTDVSCSTDNQSCIYDNDIFWSVEFPHPCANEAFDTSFRCMCVGGYYTCKCRGDRFAGAKEADETDVEALEIGSGASAFSMATTSSLLLMGGAAALL